VTRDDSSAPHPIASSGQAPAEYTRIEQRRRAHFLSRMYPSKAYAAVDQYETPAEANDTLPSSVDVQTGSKSPSEEPDESVTPVEGHALLQGSRDRGMHGGDGTTFGFGGRGADADRDAELTQHPE
jgi:hypothetical protein